MPQSPIKGWWVPHIERSVAACLANYRVDTQRVVLTGYSAGGKGVWDYSAQYGQRLAAAMPIDAAGHAVPNDTSLRVWAVHGEKDYPGNSATPLDLWFGLAAGHPGGLLATYPTGTTATAHWDGDSWAWRSGIIAPPTRGGLTIRAGATHGSWKEVYKANWFWTWAQTQRRSAGDPGGISSALACSADAHVRGGTFANNNYGTAVTAEVKLQADAQWTRRAYLRFPLPSGDISAARLELRQTIAPPPGTVIRVRRSQGPWSENAVTWHIAPNGGEVLATLSWNGNLGSADLGALGSGGGSLELLIDSSSDTGGANAFGFATREHSDPALRPVLRCTFIPSALARR
jgi:hypothetical protein